MLCLQEKKKRLSIQFKAALSRAIRTRQDQGKCHLQCWLRDRYLSSTYAAPYKGPIPPAEELGEEGITSILKELGVSETEDLESIKASVLSMLPKDEVWMQTELAKGLDPYMSPRPTARPFGQWPVDIILSLPSIIFRRSPFTWLMRC